MILCTDQHQRDPDRPITTITHGATGQWQLQSEIYKLDQQLMKKEEKLC